MHDSCRKSVMISEEALHFSLGVVCRHTSEDVVIKKMWGREPPTQTKWRPTACFGRMGHKGHSSLGSEQLLMSAGPSRVPERRQSSLLSPTILHGTEARGAIPNRRNAMVSLKQECN